MILLGQTYAELVLRASKQTFAAREHTHTAADISGVPKLVADKFAGSLVLPFAGVTVAVTQGAGMGFKARPIVVLCDGRFWARANNIFASPTTPYCDQWTVAEAADEIYDSQHYADCNVFYNTADGSVWTRQDGGVKLLEFAGVEIPAEQFTELN